MIASLLTFRFNAKQRTKQMRLSGSGLVRAQIRLPKYRNQRSALFLARVSFYIHISTTSLGSCILMEKQRNWLHDGEAEGAMSAAADDVFGRDAGPLGAE